MAVALVLLFHSGFVWAKGGYLGVTVFFVLSGFLIGGLLLLESDRDGSIDLRRFWSRRARRLVPAVVVLSVLVAAYSRLALPNGPSGSLLGDAISSLGWFANWRFVLTDRSYGDLFGAPSPFQHMWSLGIEEQFYIGLSLLALLVLVRGKRERRRGRFAVVLALGVAASTFMAMTLHDPGGPTGRAYYGTDARVAEPLIGVLLALLLVKAQGVRRLRPVHRGLLDATGVLCLAGLAALVVTLDNASDALYRGGFLAAAILAAGLVAAGTQPGSIVARALSIRPLAALGRISYGVYLFHWPVFLWLTPQRTGLTAASLLAVRVVATLALAAASYYLIEDPIRLGLIRARPALMGAAAVVAASLALVFPLLPVGGAGSAFSEYAAATPPSPPPRARTVVPKDGSRTTSASLRNWQIAGSPSTVRAGTRKTKSNAALEGTGQQGQRAPAQPPGWTSDALRVAVVGDSLAANLARGLTAWAQTQGDVVVYSLATPGCPLSSGGGTRRFPDGTNWAVGTDCDWWTDPSSTRSQYLRQFDADVVVMEAGINELPDRKLPAWPAYRHAGEPRFDGWLTNEYSAAIDAFSDGGANVLALNTPCADWDLIGSAWASFNDGEGDRRISALGNDHRLLAGKAQLGDLHGHLCPNGRWSDSVDGVEDARPDGYHLSEEGAQAVARVWLGPLVRQTATQTPLG